MQVQLMLCYVIPKLMWLDIGFRHEAHDDFFPNLHEKKNDTEALSIPANCREKKIAVGQYFFFHVEHENWGLRSG